MDGKTKAEEFKANSGEKTVEKRQKRDDNADSKIHLLGIKLTRNKNRFGVELGTHFYVFTEFVIPAVPKCFLLNAKYIFSNIVKEKLNVKGNIISSVGERNVFMSL